jgi:hypothetical protein
LQYPFMLSIFIFFSLLTHASSAQTSNPVRVTMYVTRTHTPVFVLAVHKAKILFGVAIIR